MENHAEDLALAQACLAGEEGAWRRFEESHRNPLVSLLVNRGARREEAEDIVAVLWMDIGGFGSSREPLLKRFLGTGPLKCWLSSVATMRLIALRRRKRLVIDLRGENDFDNLMDSTPAAGGFECPQDLGEAMRASLLRAWRKCPAELRVMLQLVHSECITQREISKLWGWHESKICRTLEAAMQQIRKDTLAEISAHDPESVLNWRDFIELGNRYESLLHAAVPHVADFRAAPLVAVG
jgi:DNA-directed RNA polymerase specialized sigma24 family protein